MKQKKYKKLRKPSMGSRKILVIKSAIVLLLVACWNTNYFGIISPKNNNSSSFLSEKEDTFVVDYEEASSVSADPGPTYRSLYPELCVKKPDYSPRDPEKKMVYLSFDDGPSDLTIPLLNVLDQYQVKATFFVIGKTGEDDVEAMKEIVNRGHTIGVHSYSHKYREIYASVDTFLDDFKKQRDVIYQATGVEPMIYRFPGGSVNDFNEEIIREIVTEMNRRGYTYYDWNVSSTDAEGTSNPQEIYHRVVDEVEIYQRSIVLCHNTSSNNVTLQEMPRIVETLKNMGCTFAALDPTVEPIIFPMPES